MAFNREQWGGFFMRNVIAESSVPTFEDVATLAQIARKSIEFTPLIPDGGSRIGNLSLSKCVPLLQRCQAGYQLNGRSRVYGFPFVGAQPSQARRLTCANRAK
jgi:hypothetical protein